MVEASRYPDLFRSVIKYPEKYVGSGLDSNIYFLGDRVWKLYVHTPCTLGCYDDASPSIRPEHLEFYCQITNLAAILAKRINFTFPDGNSGVPILINPVEEYWWEHGRGFGIAKSKFIPGPQFDENSAPSLGLSLSNSDINKILWERSLVLDNVLGVRGIQMSRLNTKVDKGTLIVTDICCDLRGLRKGQKRSILQ